MNTQDKIVETLELVFGQPVDPNSHFQRSQVPGWDSIKHLELVFALEDIFAIRFDASEVPTLDGLEALCAAVERHLAA